MKKVQTAKKIMFPEKKKFLIIGSGDPVKTFIKSIVKYFNRNQIYIMSHQQCDAAWSVHETEPIEKVARDNGLRLEFIEDANSEAVGGKIKELGCNVCFVIGSRWIFKKDFIDLFGGRIFNYHTSDLPNYKGGGGYRWQVMNQEKNIYIAFHQITEDIDGGDVLALAKKKIIPKNAICPEDIFSGLYEFTQEYFDVFAKKLVGMKSAELAVQDIDRAAYFPLLDNEINGAIDFNWEVKDIKLFIDSFSYPYKGAFLYYKEQKIFVKEAEVFLRKDKFHPFAIGLIINKTDDYLEVVGNKGCIFLKNMTDAEGRKLPVSFFNKGDRLYVPCDILLQSKLYRPSNKNFILKVGDKK